MRSSSRSASDFGLTSDDGVALTRRQAVAGASVVVLALVAVLVAALVVEPRSAQRPEVVTGSLILEDDRPPVVVDLATGRPSIRLKDVFAQVGAESYSDVQIVELDTGSMLVNRRTGMFNLLNRGHLAVKREGDGVGLGDTDDVESAGAVAAGNAAYIIQRSATATRVSLVGRDTVEAAVQATAAGGGTVRPRGFVEIDNVVLDEPGRVLGDGHALWVLAGAGDDLEVLRIEPDRDRPRVLTVDAEATVEAPAALALHHTDGHRVAVVGADGGRLLGGEGGEAALADDGEGADTVLPVDTETGPATFLRHLPDGWEVVTAGADGALDRAAIEGIGDQQLTPGATAGGEVWTYVLPAAGSAPAAGDDGQPALLRIDRTGQAEPVAGMDRYPRKAAGELAGFEDAAVVARSGRVVFNNPASVLAVMAFAEGDRPPVVIDKSTAIDVSANGAVATGEEETPDPGEAAAEPPAEEPGVDAPAPATVSEDARCAETDSQPRVPVLKAPSMSVRTATITWSYPLLDNADCHPSSFSVSVRALQGRQPAQPFVEVVGQTSTVVSGLRPATGYEFIVTAYLNDRSTPSLPRTGTTLPTGPVAPTGVQVTADGQGGWGVTWQSCGGDECDVPVGEWVVTGSRCGGGFVGEPPVVRVDGTTHTATIDGVARGLLGAELSFRVQGVGYDGLAGDPAASAQCVEAWRPPDPARMDLTAAASPALDGTVTARLAITTAGPLIEAFGSRDVELTYDVSGRTVGPTRALAVEVPGLDPGQTHEPRVTVTPVEHPEAAVVLSGPSFSQTLPWPSMSMSAELREDPLNPNVGALVIEFRNRPSVDMDAVGSITCGSHRTGIRQRVQPATDTITVSRDLVSSGGVCHIELRLRETSTQLFGTESPALSADIEVGDQVDPAQLSARWISRGRATPSSG